MLWRVLCYSAWQRSGNGFPLAHSSRLLCCFSVGPNSLFSGHFLQPIGHRTARGVCFVIGAPHRSLGASAVPIAPLSLTFPVSFFRPPESVLTKELLRRLQGKFELPFLEKSVFFSRFRLPCFHVFFRFCCFAFSDSRLPGHGSVKHTCC